VIEEPKTGDESVENESSIKIVVSQKKKGGKSFSAFGTLFTMCEEPLAMNVLCIM
jgi:hypothetical protein